MRSPISLWATISALWVASFGGAFAQVFVDRLTTNEEVLARLAELVTVEKNLPENEVLLIDEVRKLDDELALIRRLVSQRSELKTRLEELDKIKIEVVKIVDELKGISCTGRQDGQAFPPLGRLNSQMRRLRMLIGQVDFSAIPDPPVSSVDASLRGVAACEEMKSAYADDAKQRELLTYFDTVRAGFGEEAKQVEMYKTNLSKMSDAIQKRKALVQDRINAKSTQQQISGSLWLVIGVIGIFSLGAILAVKLFDPPLQMEWVVSGQVIQFVTVMILLSVVMALGLASVLKENTLGTLLGGIAGYVLAQGVGRAAAREATRGRSDVSSSGGGAGG